MHSNYSAAKNPRTLKAIKQEIRKAKKLQEPIFLVELADKYVRKENLGSTHSEILFALKNYHNTFLIKKSKIDGSHEILRKCKILKLSTKFFKVVGIYTNCCVYKTVSGLLKLKPRTQITLVANGCSGNRKTTVNLFKKLSKLTII